MEKLKRIRLSTHTTVGLLKFTEETAKAAQNFFQVLETDLIHKLAFQGVEHNNVERLNLGNFQSFIKRTVDTHNKAKQPFTTDRTFNQEADVTSDGSIKSIQPIPTEDIISTKNSEDDVQKVPGKFSEKREPETQDDAIDYKEKSIKSLHHAYTPCNPECRQLQVKIENLIIGMLKKEAAIFNFTNIIYEVNKHKEDDYHNLLVELEEICKLLRDYASNLRNMFDNYVCFYGPEDKELYSNLIGTASTRVFELLKSKYICHYDFLSKILEICSQKLQQVFYEENNLIIANEKKIASKICARVLAELDRRLNEYRKCPTPVSALDQMHSSLKFGLVTFMTRVSDHGGKLNQVQTEASKSLITRFAKPFTAFSTDLKEGEYKQKWPIKYAIYQHQRQMKKIYDNLMKFENTNVLKCLTENIKKVIMNLQTDEDKDEAMYLLNGHVTYIMSFRIEGLLLGRLGNAKQAKCLKMFSMFLGPRWVRIHMMSADGFRKVNCSNPSTEKWPDLIVLDRHDNVLVEFMASQAIDQKLGVKQSGQIHNFAGNTVGDEKLSYCMLQGLFKHFKQLMEQSFEKEFPKILLIVPTWYQFHHFERLRESTNAVGFLGAYIVKESSLIARQVLYEAAKDKDDTNNNLAIVVIVYEDKLSVEIYSMISADHDAVIMLAQTSPRVWSEPVQNFSFNSKNLPVKSKTTSKDEMLHLAYTQAMALISDSRSMEKKFCMLLEDTDEWLPVFSDYFRDMQNTTIINYARNTKYMERAIETISKNPEKIRQMHIDYLRVDNLELSFSSKSEVETLVTKKVDQSQLISKNKELEKRVACKKQALLKRCESIREQMVSGKVRVRRLYQKDINESLDRAEEISRHTSTNLKDIEDQESEINELVAEHNFYEEDGSTWV